MSDEIPAMKELREVFEDLDMLLKNPEVGAVLTERGAARVREGTQRVRGNRRGGKRRRIEPLEEVRRDLLAEGIDFGGDQVRREWVAVHPFERPRLEVEPNIAPKDAPAIDQSSEPRVGEGTGDVGEHFDHPRILAGPTPRRMQIPIQDS